MTTPADDLAAEGAFEALLAGRPVPPEAAGLAAFTGAVRASATQPGRPNAALAELLATGLLTDQSSPSTRTAVAAGPLPSRRARVRRRRFAMIFPALLAKFLAAGAVAQACTSAGVVLVVATGAGATGLLGNGVQDGLSSAVGASDSTVDPTSDRPVATGDPEPTPDPGLIPTTPAETSAPMAPTETGVEAFVNDGPDGYASFGAWVSSKASDAELRAQLRAEGISFGEVVRTWAHQKGLTETELTEDGVDLGELDGDETAATAEPTEPIESTESGAAETQEHAGNGNGNGKNSGGGHGHN